MFNIVGKTKWSIFTFAFAECRFPELTDEEYEGLLINKLSKNTKTAISQAVNVFSQYCLERKTKIVSVENMSASELDAFLAKFYAEVRKSDGSLYSKNALQLMRYGLQKHFLAKGFDIIKDKHLFTSSSNMYSAVLVNLKREGKGAVQHKEPLTTTDFEKLYSSNQLDISSPESLQNNFLLIL